MSEHTPGPPEMYAELQAELQASALLLMQLADTLHHLRTWVPGDAKLQAALAAYDAFRAQPNCLAKATGAPS